MNASSGLTLVEVLIAMVLVLVVSTASLAFVARGRAAYRAGESLAELQETLDAALAVLEPEIAMAGYLGLAPPASNVAGSSPVGSVEAAGLAVSGGCIPSLALDLAEPLSGADGVYESDPGRPLQCRPGPDGRAMPGADTLILRRAAAVGTAREPGRLQLETSLRQARLVADGSSQFGTTARFHDLEVGAYYVSADSTGRHGRPSLRRKRLVGGTRPAFQDEELVSGIADLQVEFGIDSPGDGISGVERWIAPGLQGPGESIRAVRLHLVAVSEFQPASLPAQLRRQQATRVIAIRNVVGLP